MYNKYIINKKINFWRMIIMKNKYKLIKHYKGYCIMEYADWSGEKESLEEIYKDSDNVEIVWLD